MYKKENYILIALLFFLSCGTEKSQRGTFVSTKNQGDTLMLLGNGAYLRKVKYGNELTRDEGTWFYDDSRIWFNDWINRGETRNTFNKGIKQSVAFSYEKSFSGKIKEIYFDVDNYYYYERID